MNQAVLYVCTLVQTGAEKMAHTHVHNVMFYI